MKFISNTNDIRKYLGLKSKNNIKFNNISIDTRTIKKDSLFIALKGENFNGNKFIEKAFASGANAVLCSNKAYKNKNNAIYVPSVRDALSKISSNIASDFQGKKILITGSNGIQFYKSNSGSFAGNELVYPDNYIQLAGLYFTD